MSTFTVASDVTYGPGDPTDVDTIVFTNLFPATASFAASDFDNFHINNSLQIDGSVGINKIVVSGGSLDASGWNFNDWSPCVDGLLLASAFLVDDDLVGCRHVSGL